MVSKEIKSYTLIQMAGSLYRGIIYLHDDVRDFAMAAFIPDPILPNCQQDQYGNILLFFPQEAFSWVVDMLRNEKPCYLYYSNGGGYISTSEEPVGENELVPSPPTGLTVPVR